MSERKTPSRPLPAVEVVRRSVVPAPKPRPTVAAVFPPRAVIRAAPSHAPSTDQVQKLAQKERVPERIAKGELLGKMRCRIWKRLHAEEAKRFDQAYNLVAQYGDLSLEEAFGLLQSKRSIESFRERRRMANWRTELLQARREVPADGVDHFVKGLIDGGQEVCFVLGDRTLVDVLTGGSAGWFLLQRLGRLEKLKLVLMAPRTAWEVQQQALQREPKLMQKPAPIIREPDRRPVADPRPFLALRGRSLRLTLRNGIQLHEKVIEVGPFDLLLDAPNGGLFVPFHAIVRWAPELEP